MSYVCPCCDTEGVEFLDWKPTYKNVVCTNCNTHPRHRALVLFFKRHPTFTCSPLKLLHFAPHSAVKAYLSSLANLDYVTADIAAHSNGQPVDRQIDVTQIPDPDHQFDVVLCSHVLEHIDRDRVAMAELYRILKPGGWAFLAVPINKHAKTFEDPSITDPQLRIQHFGQANHVRYYGTDYSQRLASVGFQVQELTVAQLLRSIPPDVRLANGLRDREIFHFAVKPAIVF